METQTAEHPSLEDKQKIFADLLKANLNPNGATTPARVDEVLAKLTERTNARGPRAPSSFLDRRIRPKYPSDVAAAGEAWAASYLTAPRPASEAFTCCFATSLSAKADSAASTTVKGDQDGTSATSCADQAEPAPTTATGNADDSDNNSTATTSNILTDSMVATTPTLEILVHCAHPKYPPFSRANSRAVHEQTTAAAAGISGGASGSGSTSTNANRGELERIHWLRHLRPGSTLDVRYHAASYAHPHWHEGIVIAVEYDEGDVPNDDGEQPSEQPSGAEAAVEIESAAGAGSPSSSTADVSGDVGQGRPPTATVKTAARGTVVPRTRRWIVVHCLAFPYSRQRVRVSFGGHGKEAGAASTVSGGDGGRAGASPGGALVPTSTTCDQSINNFADKVLAPAYTKVRNWRQQLRPGTRVELHRSLLSSAGCYFLPRKYRHEGGRAWLVRAGSQWILRTKQPHMFGVSSMKELELTDDAYRATNDDEVDNRAFDRTSRSRGTGLSLPPGKPLKATDTG